MDPSSVNFFMHVPRPSPNVVEFLYSLCAWADERHREASECLLRRTQTLHDLLSKIAGVQVDSIVSMELISLGHAESLDLSVFLVIA